MTRNRQERLKLAKQFIEDWKQLERQYTDAVGYLQMKFVCSRQVASRLLDAVEAASIEPTEQR